MNKKRRSFIVTGAIVLSAVVLAAGFGVFQMSVPLRPTVCDRTGRPLLEDRRKLFSSLPVRRARCGSGFAAALLGRTVVKDGKRIGATGVEYLIDRRRLKDKTLFLTLDAGIQEKCETMLDRIMEYVDPEYIYITVLDADGGLTAAAQRSVIDLDDRSKVDPKGTVLMASTDVFPISNAWMRLLGSSSDAPPEEKLKLGFHRKTGFFPGEGKGVIRKADPKRSENDGAGTSAQSANALKFLLAYIGTAEKKPIPELKLFLPDADRQPRLQIAGETRWRSMRWSKDRSTLSALGTIPLWGGAELYVMLRMAFPRTLPAKYRMVLEKMIRNYPGALSGVDYLSLQEMKSGIFSDDEVEEDL